MTPARLEEVRIHVEHQRRYYGAQQPRPVSAAVELLAEVKRLREVLLRVDELAVEAQARAIIDLVDAGLVGAEPTP